MRRFIATSQAACTPTSDRKTAAMTLSNTGAASNGLVYITMSGKDASGNSVVEQGSGILLSDDEVLTAAHLVYNPDGSVRTSGTASVGYNAGISIASSMVDGVQVGPYQDYTSVAGMGDDFAVVHLKTKVTNGTVFALGSNLASGTFQVSGYPVGTSGTLDNKTETLSVASGTEVYTGETLHDGSGNPNGSSGGSIYQVVNGVPTAYGVISAALTGDNTKGLFKELTSADVAQIQGWVAAADNTGTLTSSLAATTTTTAASASTAVAHSAPGFHSDMADMLRSDAAGYAGNKQSAMMDVAAAISKACQDGGSFTAMSQDAAAYLDATSSNAGRDVSYLAGLLSGTTGSWVSNIWQTANNLIGGSVSGAATKAFANAGRKEGLSMGIENTSAVIDQHAATLASVISHPGAAADMDRTWHPLNGAHHATIAVDAHSGRTASSFA